MYYQPLFAPVMYGINQQKGTDYNEQYKKESGTFNVPLRKSVSFESSQRHFL